MFILTVKGLGNFKSDDFVKLHQATIPAAAAPLSAFGLVAFVISYVIGFFATAGAAGVDFGTNSRDERDVHLGGFVGIAIAIIFTAGLAMLIVAGAYGNADMAAAAAKDGKMSMDAFSLIPIVLGAGLGKWVLFLLAISAFPAACFSSFIAANSFKTTLSNVNPFISVGIGTAVSILLAIFGWAGQLIPVFNIIGASFGPICGAMAVDYMLNGCKWAGPRAGFNPAGWLAWGFGFIVGIMPNLGLALPLAPLWAMVVGAVIYYLTAKMGLQSSKVELK
jgi:cytosine permease